MSKKPPPSKGLCLHLAMFYHDLRDYDRSWDYLIAWAAYDDWVELYWDSDDWR